MTPFGWNASLGRSPRSYAIINFNLELSRSGLLMPSYTLVTAELDLFRSWRDTSEKTFATVVEAILYAGMVYYLMNEFREVYSIYDATGTALGYFKDFWNVIDWSLIVLSFFALIQRIMFALDPAIVNFDPFANEYQEVVGQARRYNESFAFDAIAGRHADRRCTCTVMFRRLHPILTARASQTPFLAATFGIIKIFRYFELQRNLHILRSSIERGIGDLSSFVIVLMIMILGFSISGMNIFGQEYDDFVNPLRSFVSLFMTVLGEFDLDRMLAVDGIFGYLFFAFYRARNSKSSIASIAARASAGSISEPPTVACPSCAL